MAEPEPLSPEDCTGCGRQIDFPAHVVVYPENSIVATPGAYHAACDPVAEESA